MSFRRGFARMEHSIYDELEKFWKSSRHPWQAITFVQRALQQRYKIEVARLLSTETGQSLISYLLEVEYPSAENACFEEYVIPLCYLLSDSNLVSCNTKYLYMIYREVVKHDSFFDRYVRFLKDVSDSISSNMLSHFRIKNWPDAIIPFMDLGFFLLTRLGSFENRTDVENSMREAISLVGLFRTSQENQAQNMNLWIHLLDRSRERLEKALNPVLPAGIEPSSDHSICLTRDSLDAVEYMRMKPCFPTGDEILSCEEVFQESNDWFSDISRAPGDDVAQYAQHQFNDMRQRMILPHRAALRSLIQESSFSSRPGSIQFRDEVCEGRCDLFWDARVEGLDTRLGRGGCFGISVDQRFKYEDPDMRKKAWNPMQCGQLLENFSVVCLLFYDADTLLDDLIDKEGIIPGCKLVFAHVTTLARQDLYEDYHRSYLEVTMESEDDTNRLIDLAFGEPNDGTQSRVLKAAMLQLRNPLASVVYALCKCLQNSDWLSRSRIKQFVHMSQESSLNETLLSGNTGDDYGVDLSFLVRDHLDPLEVDSARKELESVDISDPRALYQKLRHHSVSIVLDDSQTKALSMCLGNGLSLIQGSPAFGESLVVSCIVKALLSRRFPPNLKWAYDSVTETVTHNFEERDVLQQGPILCIGLSNTTADDVLEELLSMNFLKENEVLRLGSQSKSSTLGHRSIRAMQQNSPFEVPAKVHSDTKSVMRKMSFQFKHALRTQPIDAENLKACARDIFKLSKNMQSMKILDTLGAMKGIKVIGCTAAGSAIHGDLIRAIGPSAIIFLGAHGLYDANILGVQASSTKQVVLVGDCLHPSLSETIQLRQQGKSTSGRDKSMFKRLVSTSAVPVETLTVQYRMHPAISNLARISYKQIQDSDVVLDYPNAPRGLAKPLFFVDHSVPEERNDTSPQRTSHCMLDEAYEVKFASNLVRYLIFQDYSPHQIAVISPSLLHLIYIKERLSSYGIRSDFGEKTGFDVAGSDLSGMNIDSQRRNEILSSSRLENKERDSVILGTSREYVRKAKDILIVTMTPGNASGLVRDFQEDSIVTNIITRARYGLIILGSSITIRNAEGGKVLKEILSHLEKESLIGTSLPLQCQEHGNVTHVTMNEDIPEEGGCNQVCGKKMTCGQRCSELCHPPTFRCICINPTCCLGSECA